MIPQPIDTVPLFQRLAEEERQMVTARLKRRQVAPGELILTEGHPSDSLYIITTGWVKLEGGIGNAVTLANLGAGSLLGELDILLDRPYSMTARAAGTTPTQLLVLSRSDLEDLIHARPSIGLKFGATLGVRIAYLEKYLVQRRLRDVELLSALSEEDLSAIAKRLDFHTSIRGDVIVEAGSPGDAAYLIEDGHVRLMIHSHEGESFEELDEGDLFGHVALITGKNQPATARTVSDVSAWVLTRKAYQEIIRERPAVKLAFSRALAESLSPMDQSDAAERMRQLQLFSDLPTEALTALAARLALRHCPADEAIYTEGTPGDAMYIVESGEVRLMDSAFADAQLLERARAGEAFGEMALLTGRTRAECARAALDTTVWVLYKSDFDDVMVQYPEISISLSRAITERLTKRESDFVIRHLRRINLFASLTTSELKALSRKVRGLRFRPGEIICFAGQPVHTLFMIENGEVKRFTVGQMGEPIMLDILDSGDSFGEQELVQNVPYYSTAQAIGEVELWTISKGDFQQLMQEYPQLAINITRMMAERLARAQQKPSSQRIPPPRGNAPVPPQARPTIQLPPRAPAARPMHSVPPPGSRIQQQPSGARPVSKPAPQKPAPPPKAPTPHKSTAMPLGASHQHTAPATQPHLTRTHPPATTHHAPHMPAHSSQQHVTPPLPRATHPPRQHNHFFNEFGDWLIGLSIGAKLRVAVVGVLFVWIALIALPFTTVTTVSSGVAGLQLFNSPANSSPNNLNAPRNTGGNSAPKVAFAYPTDTPVPTRTPQPTFTPRPQPTLKPVTRTPAPATAVPVVAAVAAPPPVPALPPAFLDPRIGDPSRPGAQVLPHLDSVKIIPASVAKGQKFWRAVSVKFEDITESGNDHTIYVKVIDENGKRVDGKKLHLTSEPGGLNEYPEEKPAGDMCDCNANYPMYGDGYAFNVEDQYPSDKVAGMIMPMKRHVNYRVIFQLSTMP